MAGYFLQVTPRLQAVLHGVVLTRRFYVDFVRVNGAACQVP
ncbi:hypothetical protein FrEUN1fDRAFT_4116 [Parafrankia sp. EUN1f]|nr:hypothetical protein FrEUN1fDRAFT_4116 [Parafrankia sp. EUN1f]